MRRTLLTTSLITAAGLALTGVSTCGPQGPAARDFAAGSLVIPMDNCYQRRDASTPSQLQGCTAAAGADDGVFRAYGLVYFLLKHNVPVYWAIDNNKASSIATDVAVPGASNVVAAQIMNWANGTFANLPGLPSGSGISYIGGPFIIDASDVSTYNVVSLLQTNADFARFKTAGIVDIHMVQSRFHANQVRPLSGPPPKIAILNVNPANKKTSVDVMYRYAVAAGLDWPCTPAKGDCAGGVTGDGTDTTTQGCKLSALQAYLTDTGVFAGTGYVNPPITTAQFNNGPGLVYDILCDNDFYAASGKYTDTALYKNGYKLLWAPHWEEGTQGAATPNVPPKTAADILGLQLACIRSFVDAGNNVFAECHAIFTLEGGTGSSGTEFGLPITRFQSTNSMTQRNSTAGIALAFSPSAYPDPTMQVGDFAYAVTSGSVSAYLPDAAATQYVSGVKRFITETASGNLDVATTVVVMGGDGVRKGSVAYLGGHDYSPGGQSPQTAGTRIVLNTLFNLGFGCADPNTTCTTGLLGACAQGVLKCAGGGGLQCSGQQPAAVDCTTPGADANCNGIPDANEQACQPVSCTEGAKQECYDGPASTDPGPLPATKGICSRGTQTCTGGLWGPCAGEVLPRPEVCNGIDDACTGTPDQGKLCGLGYSCQAGMCLPDPCAFEAAQCPAGFSCVSAKCVGQPCAGNGGLACGPGQVCQAGQCKNPCDGIVCGPGSSCSGGQCVAGGCALDATACGQGLCVSGTCAADPCASSSCPEGTFCRIGPMVNGAYVADCVRSCAYVGCATGQSCGSDGFCQSDCSPACATGQVCQNGSCAADPCAGVLCGTGQDCSAGACIDAACKHVGIGGAGVCPVGKCADGQCVPVDDSIKTSQQTPIKPLPTSGGCGTGGSADLATTLALGAAGLLLRRRRLAPAVLRVAPVGLAVLLALGSACSKGTSPISCATGETACGGECAALQTSTLHCGACGHGCASGFQCTAGSCVFPTGNPHLVSVEPATIGRGASPTLKFTFDGLAAQPTALTVRLSGAVTAQELPLTVDGSGTATLTAQAIDLDGESTTLPATIEARLLNMPARLVSNPVNITVVDALVARTLSPALARQDLAGPATLTLQGLGFVSGATVSFGPAAGGTLQALPTAFDSSAQLTVTPPAASTLPVGRYSLVVTNPGGVTSNALTFTVSEGAPIVASVTGTKGTCVLAGTDFYGAVTGTYLYPSSVVHVTGNSINNSPLDTSCAAGTDPATGQCKDGRLTVFIQLQGIPSGSYDMTVVNPGATSLVSGKTTITVAPTCP